MVEKADRIFRDFVTDGVPASGKHKPKKSEIRAWGRWLEDNIKAGYINGGLIFDTKANLNLSLAHDENASAWVVGDPMAANNGIYRKIGASGTGSWTKIAELPYSVVYAQNAGTGTADAVEATSSVPISTSPHTQLISVPFTAANTAAMTLSINGETPRPLVTNVGAAIPAGYVQAGMAALVQIDGDGNYRLFSYGDASAIQAAAEAAQLAAEDAVDRAEAARDIAAGYASDAVSQGNVPIYATVAGMAAIEVPVGINALRVNGYYSAGDGGAALYKKVDDEPGHAGKFQSADGAWWELADAYETDAMFGGEGRLAYSARGALGNYNTKLGLSVGANLTGGFNLLAGYNTGSNMTSGARNVLLGHNLGSGDTIYPEDNKPFTGTDNNAIGYHALKKNQDGSHNNALGRDALNENYSGSHNVAVGTGAGQQIVDSNDNVFIGSLAGARAFDTEGLNVYVGRDAGRENKSGERSTLIGWGAGRGITPPPSQYTGDGTTKTFNVPGFVFTEVKQVRVDVNGVNVLPAHYSVNGVDGEVTLDFAPAPGDSVVLTPTIGTSNHSRTVAVGQRSLYSIKTGDGNVSVGSEAGMSLEQGTGNVIIGTYAAESMTEGSGNIIIGQNAYKEVTSANNRLVIANQSSVPFIEGQMDGATASSNMLTVDAALRPAVDDTRPCGTASRRWNAIFSTSGTINTSDEREKDNIVDADTDEAAMRAVRKIKIRRFQWKEAISRKGPEGARLHFGVIAQEVKEAFESEGLDPFRYGVLCYDEWPEERGMVPSGRVDENGDPIMVEAVTVEGGNRYGVRMDQLLALKIAAMEAE